MNALEVKGLDKSFGGLRVTKSLDLTVAPGERRLIIGPNGAGKTTLFNLITGEISPDHGTVRLFDADITSIAARRRAHLGMARTYQIITLFPKGHTPSQSHSVAPRLSPQRWNPWTRLHRNDTLQGRALAALATVGLDHLAARTLAETSYGERRRVEIAMALAQKPRLLLLDEPFAGLSVDERRDVQKLIFAIPRDVTLVMIEHDMDVALDLAERISVMHFGAIVVEGTRGRSRCRSAHAGDLSWRVRRWSLKASTLFTVIATSCMASRYAFRKGGFLGSWEETAPANRHR